MAKRAKARQKKKSAARRPPARVTSAAKAQMSGKSS